MREPSLTEDRQAEVTDEVSREAAEEAFHLIACSVHFATSRLIGFYGALAPSIDRHGDSSIYYPESTAVHGQKLARDLLESIKADNPIDFRSIVSDLDEHNELVNQEAVVDAVKADVMRRFQFCVDAIGGE